MKKSLRKILVLAASLILALSMAVPVFAASLDEATEESLKSSVQQFLEQVYTLDDASLQQMRASGGFYEVFYDSWEEEKDTVGDVQNVEVTDVKQDEDDGTITVTADVQFSKKNAEVILYFDSSMQPTNYEMNVSYTLGEKLEQAAQNMAVGLIVVFAILIFLTFVIYLFRFIPNGDKKAKKASSDSEEPVIAPARPAASQAAVAAGTESEDEIIAVMAAAIAAANEEAPVEGGYVVRSIRKVGSRGWKRV